MCVRTHRVFDFFYVEKGECAKKGVEVSMKRRKWTCFLCFEDVFNDFSHKRFVCRGKNVYFCGDILFRKACLWFYPSYLLLF